MSVDSRPESAAVAALALALGVSMGCGGSSVASDVGSTPDAPRSEDGGTGRPVVELAIRRLNAGQEVAEFETARAAFVSSLRTQRGVQADREFHAFFDFGTGGPPTPEVFVGMTQYESIEAFQAAGEALGDSPEASAFFGTFSPITFTVLGPLRDDASVDITNIADQAGQVLEIAVRDLSRYTSFDEAAYGRTRDAFLALLTAQDGVVAEYQWRSVSEPSLVVGMTVYRSAEAFQSVATSSAIQAAPETAAFLGSYPPIAGIVTSVVH